MKKCDLIESEKLTAYIDGELSDNEMQAVAKHISQCNDCKHLVEELEELSNNTSFYYERIESSIELPNLMNDLNKRIKNLDSITDEYTKTDNIIEFPKVKKEKNDNIFNKIYKFTPAIVSLAAILLITFGILTTKKNITTTINTQAKNSESVTIDSLEYSKFNAMIYKTKDKNKTVIWLFKDNDDEDDGPI